MVRRTFIAVLLPLSCFALAGCSLSSSSDATEQIATTQLGNGTVAIISDVPSDIGVISDEDFEGALEFAAANADMEQPPPSTSRKYEELRETTMKELLDAAWLEAEAEEMDLNVTQREISNELEQIKRDSFESEVEYQRFLSESHMSEEEAEDRVRLQIISNRIQEQIGGDQDEFADFVSRYEEKWRSRTLCAPDYRVEQCSNGPPS